jgi:dTDP-4-dehydrorhamnose reductase
MTDLNPIMQGKKVRVLVLGATGMLGNTVLRLFAQSPDFDVLGSVRSKQSLGLFTPNLAKRLIYSVDMESVDGVTGLLQESRPNVVINCIGLIKQLPESNTPLAAIPINALLPHQLSRQCEFFGVRLVHMSTDCVFSGNKGNYREFDFPDANDLYGRTKLLGEADYPNAITLRTSIIGHELNSTHALVDWFLSQKGSIKGYTNAIFSGLPTIELARVIRDFVIPNSALHGLYHVAAAPISKYDLLSLINREYKKGLEIQPDDQVKVDRSLNAQRFQSATGYVARSWPELISQMHAFQEENRIVQ